MDDIEKIATDVVNRYVEQIRPFTDRIAQLETSRECMKKEAVWYAQKVEELEASNAKWKGAIDAVVERYHRDGLPIPIELIEALE